MCVQGIILPTGKCCLPPGLHLCSWSQGHFSSQVLSSSSPCHIAHGCVSIEIPPPAQSHDLVLHLHQPRVCTLPRQESQEVQQGGVQSPMPEQGKHQATAHAGCCPAGKQTGKCNHAAPLKHKLLPIFPNPP